jgi:NADPH-dependent curcumin reductase CurA
VGGEQLSDALDAMNDFGRIVGCGMVSRQAGLSCVLVNQG